MIKYLSNIQRIRGMEAPGEKDSTARGDVRPYKVGDTVYLEHTEYQIQSIGKSSVELIQHRNNAPPVLRMEGIATFEQLLPLDSRNSKITDYLAVSLNLADADLQDVLVGDGGLLEEKDREQIAGWFREGNSNSRA